MTTSTHRVSPALDRVLSALLLALLGVFGAAPGAVSPAHAQAETRLGERAEALFSAPAGRGASWGAMVLDLTTGDTLLARRAGGSFVPASGLKLITTGTALHSLGPAFRYETVLLARGPVRDGRLHGDLLIRGSGDPTIGAEPVTDDPRRPLRAWARAVRTSGIDRIEGAVVGVDSVFDEVPYGSGWSWDDLNYYYAVPTSGLTFNENCVEFALHARRPGRSTRIDWELDRTDYVTATNATVTVSADSSLEEGYQRRPGTNRFRFSSRVPAGTVDEECLAVADPTRFFAHELRRVLVEEGLVVDGPAVDADDEIPSVPVPSTSGSSGRAAGGAPDATLRRIAVHRSPPLSRMTATVNRESHNLYAEQLLKTLGRQLPRRSLDARISAPRPGSREAGLAAVDSFLIWAGADTARVRIVDGSGLSRKNLITPRVQVRVLAAMSGHPDPAVRGAFFRSLPRPGGDGTLQYRFGTLPPDIELRAKTGFMSGVRTLSGLLTTASGRELAFTVMTNHFTGDLDPIDALQERFVALLAEL